MIIFLHVVYRYHNVNLLNLTNRIAYFFALFVCKLFSAREVLFYIPFFISGIYNQGFVFCEKVKERLCSHDDYQTFLKCLNIYSNGIIKRIDLQNLVHFTLSLAIIKDLWIIHYLA